MVCAYIIENFELLPNSAILSEVSFLKLVKVYLVNEQLVAIRRLGKGCLRILPVRVDHGSDECVNACTNKNCTQSIVFWKVDRDPICIPSVNDRYPRAFP